jgi:hypothetical protein
MLRKRRADFGHESGIAALRFLISDPPRILQPGVDDLPFVTAARAEVEQWGVSILELAKELQRVTGGRRLFAGLGLKPTIPLQKNLGFPLILSHRRASSDS